MYYNNECGFDDNMSILREILRDMFGLDTVKDERALSCLGFDNMSVYHIDRDGVDDYIFLLDGILGAYALGKITPDADGEYLVNEINEETDAELSLVCADDEEYYFQDFTHVAYDDSCNGINFMVKANYQSLRNYIEHKGDLISRMDYRLGL